MIPPTTPSKAPISNPTHQPLSTRSYYIAAACIILLASIPRIVGLFDDFWLDEIWSWNIARHLHSPLQILTSPDAQIDNNHPLNTLWIYLLGDRLHWTLYRLPSAIAGILAVILAMRLMSRFGRPHALIAGALLSFSYPLTEFSSEARGYSLMTLFLLSSFLSLDSFLRKPRLLPNIIFCLSICLALLSHLSFLSIYMATLVYTAFQLPSVASWTEPVEVRRSVATFLSLHLLPLLFLLTYYLLFIRHLTVGGAPDESIPGSLARALAVTAGAAGQGRTGWIVASLFLPLLLSSLASLWFLARNWFLPLLSAILLFPALLITIQRYRFPDLLSLQPRYFLAQMTLSYLALSIPAAWLWRKSLPAKILVSSLLALYIASSSYQTVSFLQGTRGHYHAALQRLLSQSPTPTITLATDDNFRTSTLLQFYGRYLPNQRELRLYPPTSGIAQWLILNQNPSSDISTPPPHLRAGGLNYDFDSSYPSRGLSGWPWLLYRAW